MGFVSLWLAAAVFAAALPKATAAPDPNPLGKGSATQEAGGGLHLGQICSLLFLSLCRDQSACFDSPADALIMKGGCNAIKHHSHAATQGFCCVSGLGVRSIRPCPGNSRETQRHKVGAELSGLSRVPSTTFPETLSSWMCGTVRGRHLPLQNTIPGPLGT